MTLSTKQGAKKKADVTGTGHDDIVFSLFDPPHLILSVLSTIALLIFIFLLPYGNRYLSFRTEENFEYVSDYYLTGDPEKAIPYLTKMASAFPENPFFQLKAGLVFKQRSIPGAKEYLYKATESFYFPYMRFPYTLSDYYRTRYTSAFLNYGEMLLEEGKITEALFYLKCGDDIVQWTQGKSLLIEYARTHDLTMKERLATVGFYLDSGDVTTAATELALLSPQDTPTKNYFLYKGRLALVEGREKEANKLFNRELAQFPDNLAALCHLDRDNLSITSLERNMRKRGFVSLLDQRHIIDNREVRVKSAHFAFHHWDHSSISFHVSLEKELSGECFVVAYGNAAAHVRPVIEIVVNDKDSHLVYLKTHHYAADPVMLHLEKGDNTIELRFRNWGRYGLEYKKGSKERVFREKRNIFLNNIWYYEKKSSPMKGNGR